MLNKELYLLGIVLLLYKAALLNSQNRLYSNMVDVAMVAADVKRVFNNIDTLPQGLETMHTPNTNFCHIRTSS